MYTRGWGYGQRMKIENDEMDDSVVRRDVRGMRRDRDKGKGLRGQE